MVQLLTRLGTVSALSRIEPDFLGWEVKQFAVEDFERIESAKPITVMTPEPDGGFYKDADVEV